MIVTRCKIYLARPITTYVHRIHIGNWNSTGVTTCEQKKKNRVRVNHEPNVVIRITLRYRRAKLNNIFRIGSYFRRYFCFRLITAKRTGRWNCRRRGRTFRRTEFSVFECWKGYITRTRVWCIARANHWNVMFTGECSSTLCPNENIKTTS